MSKQASSKESRSDQTEDISRRIRAVALQHVASFGVDGLSMIKVAEDVGVTKSPMYRRYDDAIDLVVDVWDHHLRDHLHQVVTAVSLLVSNNDGKMLNWLAAEMHQPSIETKALAECLAVARRYDYLLESIELDVDLELTRYLTEVPDQPEDVALARIVWVLGGIFIAEFLPCSQQMIANALSDWNDYLNRNDLWLSRPMPSEIRPIPMPVPEGEDPLLRYFITAATKVISRTGYEKATANRIARYANKAFSTSYAYFDSKEELMSYATEFALRDSIVRNDMMFVTVDEDYFTDVAAARIRELSTESKSEDSRFFRIEAMLAARHHESLRLAVEDLFSQSLEQVLSVTSPGAMERFEVSKIWTGVRLSGFGHNIFGFITHNYRDINWMSMANAAGAAVREGAMVHYVSNVLKAKASS
jgi:AcrR family transcriptional regulator